MTSGTRDATRRFVIGQGAVRGEYVRLEASWREIIARRTYPLPVISLLGECLAASALFTSTLKMLQSDGRLSLQVQGGRPVSLLVAESYMVIISAVIPYFIVGIAVGAFLNGGERMHFFVAFFSRLAAYMCVMGFFIAFSQIGWWWK